MSTVPFHYPGGELELFAKASHWKAYLREQIGRYLGKRVLEVGAGIGGATREFCDGDADRWVCLEPDGGLLETLRGHLRAGRLPTCCVPVQGTIDQARAEAPFDSIVYIDVLEHIADDRQELAAAASCLAPGGYLVVLSPAHQWLYSPFDRAIGHYRRYSRRMLKALSPAPLQPICIRYLDAVGLLASLANRCLLRQSMPSVAQIAVWDNWMVPCSRWIDPLLGGCVGKSILAVWQRPPA